MAGGMAFRRREGARNVEGQGADHFGRGQRRKVLMAGVGYFGGVGGQEMLEDRGTPFWRTYDMHFEGHEAG